MIKQQFILKLVFLFFILNSHTAFVSAQEQILIPKFGVVERNDNANHLVNNNSFDFDDDIVAAPGFTYLYKMDNGVAFGAEFFGYENEIITTATNDGDATTKHIYGVVEKFFNTEGTVKPFIGVGVGFVSVSFDANVNGAISDDFEDNATDLSYELIAGAEFEINKDIGMTVEYKYFDFEVDDDIDDRNIEIESDGHGLFVGVAIHL